jgi:hypothetical protein
MALVKAGARSTQIGMLIMGITYSYEGASFLKKNFIKSAIATANEMFKIVSFIVVFSLTGARASFALSERS